MYMRRLATAVVAAALIILVAGCGSSSDDNDTTAATSTPAPTHTAKLKAAGYQVLDTDQEEGAEAEGHLSGPHTVDVQVIALCKGKVRIRYTVS